MNIICQYCGSHLSSHTCTNPICPGNLPLPRPNLVPTESATEISATITLREIEEKIEKGILDERINEIKGRMLQFKLLSLPGQPPMMHPGTGYLVRDLWILVKDLQLELKKAMEKRDVNTRD